jgi:hypothetical protein
VAGTNFWTKSPLPSRFDQTVNTDHRRRIRTKLNTRNACVPGARQHVLRHIEIALIETRRR